MGLKKNKIIEIVKLKKKHPPNIKKNTRYINSTVEIYKYFLKKFFFFL